MDYIERYKEYTSQLNEFCKWSRYERIKMTCPDRELASFIDVYFSVRDNFSKAVAEISRAIRNINFRLPVIDPVIDISIRDKKSFADYYYGHINDAARYYGVTPEELLAPSGSIKINGVSQQEARKWRQSPYKPFFYCDEIKLTLWQKIKNLFNRNQ